MKFTLAKTTLPHRVYVVDGKEIVLHDMRGSTFNRQNVIDATLEALKEVGSVSKQIGRGQGFMLQNVQLDHYQMASVNPDIVISSTKPLSATKTKPMAVEFLKQFPKG